MTKHQAWQQRYETHLRASAALCAKYKRIRRIAQERADANWRYDLLGLYAKLRVRFTRELEAIPTP